MDKKLLGFIMLFLAAPALAEQILANDIVEVGCYAPADASCTGKEGMRMSFDLCCPCFRWSYDGDVSSTKMGEYTLGDGEIGWVSHITSENCVPGSMGKANKKAGASQCIQQTEGKTYRCKIQKITHRTEACDKITPVCEQGPFATDKYVPLSNNTTAKNPGSRPGGSRSSTKAATTSTTAADTDTNATTSTTAADKTATSQLCLFSVLASLVLLAF